MILVVTDIIKIIGNASNKFRKTRKHNKVKSAIQWNPYDCAWTTSHYVIE